MDWEAFESDVWDSVNESTYADQWGSLDDSDAYGYTGVVYTIGETWQGALYMAEERANGFKYVDLFDTPKAQREYYEMRIQREENV